MMTKPSFNEERNLWEAKIEYVIGLDEVGRGAFAGPIVGAGVIFKPNFKHPFLRYVDDSKLLRSKQRKELSSLIKANSIWEIETIDIDYINKHGIGKANSAVFRKVLNKLISNLNSSSYFILIDGFHRRYLPGGIKKQKGIVKGDRKSLSIASASIIAKVYRDNLMKEASSLYPNYRFELNKGYGTREHRKAIMLYGLTKNHRKTFVKSLLVKLDPGYPLPKVVDSVVQSGS